MSAAPMPVRRLFHIAALALALTGAPLAAQAALDAEADAELVTAPEGPVEPFALIVVSGDEQSVAAHPIGEALPPAERVCLDALQFLIVTAAGEEVAYLGPGCFEPRAGLEITDEAYAGSHVWLPPSEDGPGASTSGGGPAVVVRSLGPSAETYPTGRFIAADESVALRAGDEMTILTSEGARVLSGPVTFTPALLLAESAARLMEERAAWAAMERAMAEEQARTSRRARIGAVRGVEAVRPPAPAGPVVATRGTAGALRKFPKGTLIGSPQKVCLAAGDRLTVASRSGARMTFAGPGCGQRLQNAGDDNTPAVSPG